MAYDQGEPLINRQRLLEGFLTMTSISAPSSQEGKLCAALFAQMSALGLEPYIDDAGVATGGDTGNLWGWLAGNTPGAPRLFFTAHMDSVGPLEQIKPVVREGIIYSDGTTTLGGDDKSGIAAILEAVRVLREYDLPHGDLQIFFSIGEESGCLGTCHMERERLKADFGYALDMGGAPGNIVIGAAQQVNIDFVIKGRTAHGGVNPEEGINAIMLAAQALAQVTAFGRIDEETTLNVGTICGGQATNVVPDVVTIGCDARSMQASKLTAVVDALVATVVETVTAGGGSVESTVTEGCPLISLAADSLPVLLAQTAARTVGLPTGTGVTGGGSDANFLNGYGLPCAVLATGMSKIHTTEEFLKEQDLYDTARWVLAIMRQGAELAPK
ncbi:MAG: M20/M25/M40 family metallo-hydrolase [Acidaminococcaceae bacterium]